MPGGTPKISATTDDLEAQAEADLHAGHQVRAGVEGTTIAVNFRQPESAIDVAHLEQPRDRRWPRPRRCSTPPPAT
jgi:hypothetical protein